MATIEMKKEDIDEYKEEQSQGFLRSPINNSGSKSVKVSPNFKF